METLLLNNSRFIRLHGLIDLNLLRFFVISRTLSLENVGGGGFMQVVLLLPSIPPFASMSPI